MIPLPDWTRLRPAQPPPSTLPGRGGCSDVSGCVMGCGGTGMVILLALMAWKAFGPWLGLLALAVLATVAIWISKTSQRLGGLVLGALAATGVWKLLERDHAQESAFRLTWALLVGALFVLSGHLEARRRARSGQ